MKKSIKAIIGAGVLVGAFVTGNIASGAQISWTTSVENEASKRISETGYDTKEELLNEAGSLPEVMVEKADPYIEDYEKELEKMLEEYYKMKVDGLVETEEFKNLEKRMDEIKTTIFNRYKKDIDAAVK